MERVEISAQPAGRDDWSGHWDSYADSARDNPAQDMRHRLILSAISRMAGEIPLLMDFGSGQGDFLQRAASLHIAKQLVGLELSESGVAISRAKVPEATFIRADLFKPPKELGDYRESADVAVCSEVVEHVDDPVGFLQSVRTYLKPGGRLVLTVPGGPMSAFDRHIGHRRHFDAKAVKAILKSAGFSVEKVHLAGFPFFNLYRLTVILRGKKLIDDVKVGAAQSRRNPLAVLVMRMFRFLLHLSVDDSPFGWQVIAVARKLKP
jgi:SAM-dependent methyltransferase